MNELSDFLFEKIKTLSQLTDSNTFRNRAKSNVLFPYVVFMLESQLDTYPTNDITVNIYIYDDIKNSVRNIEAIGDDIDNMLNHQVFKTKTNYVHFKRDIRQFSNDEALVGRSLVMLQYAVRIY